MNSSVEEEGEERESVEERGRGSYRGVALERRREGMISASVRLLKERVLSFVINVKGARSQVLSL